MTAEEFRWGLRWIFGLPLRAHPYACPNCGQQGDVLGVHAVTCSRSGEKVRAHNRLRNVVGRMANQLGVHVSYEQKLPRHPELRPADVLLESWQPLPLAIDFAIITPTAPIVPQPDHRHASHPRQSHGYYSGLQSYQVRRQMRGEPLEL